MKNISSNLPTGSLGLMISNLLVSDGRYKDPKMAKIYARLNEYNYVIDIEAADDEFVANSPFKNFYVPVEYLSETKKPLPKIGMLYNKDEDYFAFNKPHPSWILDENYEWISPEEIPKKSDDCALNKIFSTNTSIEEIKALASSTSTKNIELVGSMGRLLLKNKNSPYENSDSGRESFFNDLYSKVDEVSLISNSPPNGTKNLLYFTLFLDDNYLDMVEILLEGVLKNTSNINFDVLFITDEVYEEKIKQRNFYDKFHIHFMIKESPISGVRASMEKMNIHDFQLVSDYNKILFLDCDMLCLRDLNTIFDLKLEDGMLYSAVPKDISFEKIYTITHGLMYLTTKDATFIQQNPEKILAINAGQFLFLNTQRMKNHFENVKWMMKNWPSLYFFEQSFINHYFVFNGLSARLQIESNELVNFSRLKKLFKKNKFSYENLLNSLIMSGANNYISSLKESSQESFALEMVHTPSGVLLHFAGSATSGETKIKYIKDYKDAYKL